MSSPSDRGVVERPILFSGPMVRAVLAGTKTQTRRVCKLDVRAGMPEPEMASLLRCCPYGAPGTRLWVRESFAADKVVGRPLLPGQRIVYRADWEGLGDEDVRWTPSIHMPRWASRITLEVTGVRVERLQDISESDAQAEGVEDTKSLILGAGGAEIIGPVAEYAVLWEQINGPGSWEANPFVWVIEFRKAASGSVHGARSDGHEGQEP